MDSKPQIVNHAGSRPASAEHRLKELGVKLPAPPEPCGAPVELEVIFEGAGKNSESQNS